MACKIVSKLALDLAFEAMLDLISARIFDLILHPESHTPNPDEWSSPTFPILSLKPDLDPGHLFPSP